MKPIYKFQQELKYKKHKKRLQQIKLRQGYTNNDSLSNKKKSTILQVNAQQSHEQLIPHYSYELNHKNNQHARNQLYSHSSPTANTFHVPTYKQTQQLKTFMSIHNKSIKHQMSTQKKKIQQQNEKLLERLVEISTREKSMLSNTTSSKNKNIQFFNNTAIKREEKPYRKNWLKNIKKQNEELGEKLTSLRSSLDYKNICKSMSQYEKIKRSMMKNRHLKIPAILKNERYGNFQGTKSNMNIIKNNQNLSLQKLQGKHHHRSTSLDISALQKINKINNTHFFDPSNLCENTRKVSPQKRKMRNRTQQIYIIKEQPLSENKKTEKQCKKDLNSIQVIKQL